MRTSFGIALLVALFVVTSGAWAGTVPVTVPNNSFESPSCVTAGTSCTPASWTIVGSANQWLPTAGQYNSIPDGSQVAWANTGGVLEQVLTTDLAANTTYVLSVDVGLRNNEVNTFGGIVDLYAGTTLIGTATGATPTFGNWVDWTLTVNSRAGARRLAKRWRTICLRPQIRPVSTTLRSMQLRPYPSRRCSR